MGFFKKIAHLGSSSSSSSKDHHHHHDSDDRGRSHSSAGGDDVVVSDRGRSLSKTRSRSRDSRHPRDESAEGLRRDKDEFESDVESETGPHIEPANAFEISDDEYEDDDEQELWSEPDEDDLMLERNTEANASANTPADFLSKEGPEMVFAGEGPNLLPMQSGLARLAAQQGRGAQQAPPSPVQPGRDGSTRPPPQRRKSTKAQPMKVNQGRPVYEKNRCTVTLTHGDPEKASEGRRRRRYLVASDLSEESQNAVEWAIGTVLREGDECLLVSVMETDTKFDSDDPNPSSQEKQAKIKNQRERQGSVLQLARQATSLLERTRLNVTVICQAIHAKVPRHMLIDMIDYHEPTLVIVGSRGLDKIKGMLLGSVSNYLIQKSSVPVMVTRRPLRVSRTVNRKISSLNREARVSLADASIEKASQGGAAEDDPDEPDDVRDQVQKMTISEN